MKKLSLRYGIVVILGIIISGIFSIQGLAEELENPTEVWEISSGGKLYDNWAATLMMPLPNKTHQAYPSAGKKKGSATWRCKECHGWDYKGKDGAYGKGSHYTGIKGIRDMVGKNVDSIKKIIRDTTHGYTEAMIPEKALSRLALFVSRGQIEMAQYINPATKQVRGDARRGAGFFQTMCASCHGYDGKTIDFHAGKGKPQFIGTVASKNPWETLHKIRNGQPGIPMVALSVLDIQDQLDILAYTQSLPTK